MFIISSTSPCLQCFLDQKIGTSKTIHRLFSILGLGTLTGRTIFRNHPETSTNTQERPKAFISSAAAALNAWPHETDCPYSGILQAPWDWFLALKNKNHLPHLLGVSSEMSKFWNKITLQLDMQIIIVFSQPDLFSDPHPHIPNPFQPSFSWQVQLGIPWNPGATQPVPSWHVVQYPVLVPHRSAMLRSGGYWDTSTARSWKKKDHFLCVISAKKTTVMWVSKSGNMAKCNAHLRQAAPNLLRPSQHQSFWSFPLTAERCHDVIRKVTMRRGKSKGQEPEQEEKQEQKRTRKDWKRKSEQELLSTQWRLVPRNGHILVTCVHVKQLFGREG